jgi:perosamine synthetase
LEEDYVSDCIKSTFVSSVGEYVDRFEQEIAKYTGAKRAIAVVNGTAALHISLLLSGVQNGDEVLIPGLTFVATANAVSYCGARPHFVDSEEDTLGIDPIKLDKYLSKTSYISDDSCINKNTGKKISAIVPVHIFGHPCKIEEIVEVAARYKITVVEDAAESLGSFYKDKHTGTFGKFGTISFNGNKIITTGGGGMIITDDEELAQRAKHLTTTAKVPHKWEYVHDQVGYNYRMPNLNAAFGCAQLQRFPAFLQSKRNLFKRYCEQISILNGFRLLNEPTECSSNYWLQTIVLDEPDEELRNIILTALNDAGLMSRPAWTGLHKLEHFKECPKMDMTVVNSLEKRIINIPSSSFLI